MQDSIMYVHEVSVLCTELVSNMSHVSTTLASNDKATTTSDNTVDPNNIHERVKLIVLVPITSLIVIFNLIVLVFIACHRKFYRPTYLFITSLGIADLAVGCVSLATIVNSNDASFNLCLVRMGFIGCVCVASLYCMMWIAIDRYIAIMSPMTYRLKMSNRKAWMAVSLLWTKSFLIGFAPLFGWNNQNYQQYCSFLYIVTPGYTVFLFLVGFVVPMTVIVVIYVLLYRKTQIHIKRINIVESIIRIHIQSSQIRTVRVSNRTLKSLRTLMILIGCFVVTWFPFILTALTQTICGDEICRLKDIVGSYLLLLGFSNSFLNPIIYATSNKEFKSEFWSSCCISCDKRIRPTNK